MPSRISDGHAPIPQVNQTGSVNGFCLVLAYLAMNWLNRRVYLFIYLFIYLFVFFVTLKVYVYNYLQTGMLFGVNVIFRNSSRIFETNNHYSCQTQRTILKQFRPQTTNCLTPF